MDKEQNMLPDVYALSRPDTLTNAVVFSSPHSGSEYPQELITRTHLDLAALRSSEDAYIDELFCGAPQYGSPLIAAKLPRAWLDLNRAADELDPALVAGAPKFPRSPRINAGLGVIPRVVSDSRVIQDGKITLNEARERIRLYHAPYHAAVRALLVNAREIFGFGILIDCHSMPHEALNGSTTINGARPEIVLGDRFGASCDRWVMDAAMAMFQNAGFSVVRNAPFAGGYITQTYGRPLEGFHALQIEIDRSLYMDERTITKNQRFGSVQRQLNGIIRELTALGQNRNPIAAE